MCVFPLLATYQHRSGICQVNVVKKKPCHGGQLTSLLYLCLNLELIAERAWKIREIFNSCETTDLFVLLYYLFVLASPVKHRFTLGSNVVSVGSTPNFSIHPCSLGLKHTLTQCVSGNFLMVKSKV